MIQIKCQAATSLPLDVLIEFQGKLKKLSKVNLDRLKRRILADGFIAPVFVWENGGDNYVIDGHQRLQALISLRQDGEDIPFIPVAYIHADDEKQARARLLSITSQYGEFDPLVLNDWIIDVGIDVVNDLRFVNEEIKIITDIVGTDGFSLSNNQEHNFKEITFVLHNEQAAEIERLLTLAKKENDTETFGNMNSNGNALYRICIEWAELKK